MFTLKRENKKFCYLRIKFFTKVYKNFCSVDIISLWQISLISLIGEDLGGFYSNIK